MSLLLLVVTVREVASAGLLPPSPSATSLPPPTLSHISSSPFLDIFSSIISDGPSSFWKAAEVPLLGAAFSSSFGQEA